MPCFITSGAPVEQLSNGCIRSLDSFCSAHGYVDRHGGSWSWHLSSSSDATRSTKSSSSNKHGSMEKKKHSRKAPQPNDDSDEAFVPTVFLGDVFMPCNSLGLFRQHEDLDDLFGTSAHQAQPIPAKRTSQRIKSIASKQQPAQQPSPPQQQQQPAPASSLALDPASQLALRMATPIEGRRLFFVSNQSAEVIRQAQVIERYDEIMAKKAEQAAQSSAFPRPSDVREWMASLGSWMNPGSSPQGPSPFQDPTSSSGTSNSSSSSSSSGRSTSDSSGGRSSSSSSSSSSKRQGTPVESEQFQGGAGPAQPSPSTPVLSSPLLTSSSFLGGASLLGWFSSPVAALSRVLEQDLNRLEEEAVIAEAQRIAAGEEGEPTPGAGLASFVGRLPLEAAYRVMCRRPQQFDLVVTGTDARLAKAAMGKQAMLDLHAGTDDKWLFKIKDEDNQEVSHEASESDEDMAMGHRTPVFTIPGVHLALRLQGGTPVHLSPTFLSIAQLHTFTQTAKTLAGRIWLSSRASQREQLRNRVEAVAIALAGNGTLADGASGSGKARGGSSLDEDEDEEGFGDPPEAKQLLAELGEGRAGGLGPSLPPATGVVGFLNAVAVGAITFIGQATTSFANGVDRLMLASPLGLAASGVPKHLIVRAGYLEDMVAELAAENRRQRQRLEVVPLAATLQAESQAQGQIVPQTLPLQQQQQQHSHPSTSLVEQPLPQQPQQQPQQQETLLALPSPVPQTPPLSQQPLESQMGLGMVLQALWAVMHNTTTGDGKLAALLASNWLGTTKISAPKHGELSAVLAIQIKSQLASPAALPPHISTPPASSPRAKDNPHDSSAALGPTAATSSTDAASSQSERAPKLPPSDSTSGAHGHDQRPSTNAAPSLGQEAPMLPPSDTTSGTSSHNQRSQGAPSTTVVDASSGSDLSPHTHSSASAPQPSTSSSRSSRGEEAMDRDGEGKGEQGSSPQSSSSNAARHLSSSSSSSSNNNRSSNGRSNSIQVLKQPAAQTHKFEVGLHINLHDALGSDWEDSESEALEGDEGGELEGARPGKDRGRDKSVVVGDEVRAASEHTEHGRDGLGKAGQSRGAQSKRSVGQLEQRAKQGQQETPQQDRTLGHTESEGRTAGHAEGAGRTAGHGESAEKTAGRTESEKGAAGHAKSEESTAGQLEQRAKEGQQDAPQLGEGQRSGSSGGDAAPSAAAETSQQVDADAAGKGEGLLEGTQGALDQQVADGGRRRRPRQPSITNKEAAYQGLLLMSDLGLQKDEDEQPWRAPPLAFANLGVLMQEMERCRRK